MSQKVRSVQDNSLTITYINSTDNAGVGFFITVISFIGVVNGYAMVCSSGALMQKRWVDQSQPDWLLKEK